MGLEINVATVSERYDPLIIKSYLENNAPDIFYLTHGTEISEPSYTRAAYANSQAMLVFKSGKYDVLQVNDNAILLKDKAANKKIKILRDVEDYQIAEVMQRNGESKNVFQKIKEALFGRKEDDADIVIYCQGRNVTRDSFAYRTKILNQNDFATSPNAKIGIIDSLFYKARIGEEVKMELTQNANPTLAKFTVKDNDSFFWKLRQRIKSLFS